MTGLRHLWLIALASVAVAACTVSDADRCVDGFTYDATTKSCLKDAADTDSARVQPTSDTQPADTSTDTDADTGPTGYGAACLSDTDCAAFDATYCMRDPTSSNPGICTVQNCVKGECPTGSKCCDCQPFLPVMCVIDQALTDPMLQSLCKDCG